LVTPEQKKRIDLALQELRKSVFWVDYDGLVYALRRLEALLKSLASRVITGALAGQESKREGGDEKESGE
jgi:hypothetical protein